MKIICVGDVLVAYDMLTDSPEILMENMPAYMVADINSCKLEKRRRERATTYNLLLQLLDNEFKLCHRADGSPYLEMVDGSVAPYLSITHSKTMVAVAVHYDPVGIDIEDPTAKLDRVKDKYLSAREQQICSSPQLQLQAWTIKEAVYKAVGQEGLPLVDGITIDCLGEQSSIKVGRDDNATTYHTFSIVIADGSMMTIAF
jgi:phosphopantetheinyl transferase